MEIKTAPYTGLLGILEIMHIIRLVHSKQLVDISMSWFQIHSFNHSDWELLGCYRVPWRCSCEQSGRNPVLMELMFSWGRSYPAGNDLDKENQASRHMDVIPRFPLSCRKLSFSRAGFSNLLVSGTPLCS